MSVYMTVQNIVPLKNLIVKNAVLRLCRCIIMTVHNIPPGGISFVISDVLRVPFFIVSANTLNDVI